MLILSCVFKEKQKNAYIDLNMKNRRLKHNHRKVTILLAGYESIDKKNPAHLLVKCYEDEIQTVSAGTLSETIYLGSLNIPI